MKKSALRLIITIAIAIGAYFSLGKPINKFFHIYNGSVELPILAIFFSVLSFQISMANQWKFNRLGLLPGLIGIYGFFMNCAFINSCIANYMATEHELPMSSYGLVESYLSGLTPSFDLLLLGTGLSLALYMICTCVSAIQAKPKE